MKARLVVIRERCRRSPFEKTILFILDKRKEICVVGGYHPTEGLYSYYEDERYPHISVAMKKALEDIVRMQPSEIVAISPDIELLVEVARRLRERGAECEWEV